MVTMDGNPTLGQFFAWKLGKAATRRRDKAASRASSSTIFQAIVKLVLHLTGFGCLTIAGFMWSMIIGMVVAGLSCFVLSVLVTSSDSTPKPGKPMT